MWSSAVPDALENLASILRGAPGLSGIPVLFGPERGPSYPESVAVGFSGDPDDVTAVENEQAPEGMRVGTARERFSIRCSVIVSRGPTGDVPGAVRRAYEIFAGIGAALADNKTLGGAVMTAAIAGSTLGMAQADRGLATVLLFSVDCDAYTRRM